MGCSLNKSRFVPVFAVVILSAGIGLSASATAQVADSTEASPAVVDTLLIPVQGPGFPPDERGFSRELGRPARRAELGLVHLLDTQVGMMPYSFGAAGWPSSFSPYGLDPNRIELTLDGRRMDDLVTGRPRYDLLPYSLIDGIRFDPSTDGFPFGIRTNTVEFPVSQPATDLRYGSSATGLQSIDAIHTQSRPFTVFSGNDRIVFLFGYAGAASDGEYPGSRLRRARQIQARIRFERPTWSLEIYELANRRHVGAHDGVLPRTGLTYDSIYERLGATVAHPEAKRTTVRNDLSVRFRTLSLVVPLRVEGFWTTQSLQYRALSDTVTARVGRSGVSAETEWRSGLSQVSVSFTTWLDRYRSGNAFRDGFDKETAYVGVTTRGHTTISGLSLLGQLGFHSDAGNSFTSLAVDLTYGGLSLRANATGLRTNWMDRAGFGSSAHSLQQIPEGRLHRFSIEYVRALGPFRTVLTGFYHIADGTTVWLLDADSQDRTAETIPGTVATSGLAMEFAFRSSSQLGLYGLFRPTLLQTSSSDATPVTLAERSSVPEFFFHSRLGVHMLLFKRDLDLDLSARVQYWEPMAGRRLDPMTGLLMLPMNDPTLVPSSWTLDMIAEAGVRTATLFVALENVLSGTNVTVGNLLIPDYPLPAQRFRFGVFWPIMD